MSGRPLSDLPREIYRIAWLPGTDVLHGTCHCGREHSSQDPIEMWDWMLAHPQGHEPRADRTDQARGSSS
ncbi:hypothetical protein GCM10023084_56060 [Streptomyces lacrimifluminis]|uniref:Uncharacterized protein n=1 Tax=Streptomyces lacrimifluminis TaxID=1500077 RepID=A0A917KL17_9ACTN|nr:hypothetical protein [Streptomyces lacrimifluminis]GGJ16382.1 hypothetical protein GCM10012282_10630 [Streptomyces lacrimifluminis]